MPAFKIKWTINGELTVDAPDAATAERTANEKLVALLTDTTRWPAELVALSIEGSIENTPAE